MEAGHVLESLTVGVQRVAHGPTGFGRRRLAPRCHNAGNDPLLDARR